MWTTEASPPLGQDDRRPSGDDALIAYSTDPWIRRRMLEYCGATEAHPPTASYLAVLSGTEQPYVLWRHAHRVPVSDIGGALRQGDVSRALADERNLLVVLDLDYQNVDLPAEPFVHEAEVFTKLEPVFAAVRHVCATYRLPVLSCMTGRGYHFAGRVPLDSPLVDELAGLLPQAPPWFRDRERVPWVAIPERVARASAGLGLLIEFLVHQVLRAAPGSALPVVVNGTIVGAGARGRECASLDCSHLGDPLDVRALRVAFGTYRWHRFRPDIFGASASAHPPYAVLPRGRRSLGSMLARGRSLGEGRRAARHARAVLPAQTDGLRRVLDDYRESSLAAFHRAFHACDPLPLPVLDLDALPPCVAAPLRRPNDLLLRPECLQHVTRGLLARGWEARSVAELVCQVYEADHDWGDTWRMLHPRSRAEFDVRVFAGLVAAGVDRLVDFNCVSAQEKGLCPPVECWRDLRTERRRLLSVINGGVA